MLLCTTGVIMPEHLPIEKMSRTLPAVSEAPPPARPTARSEAAFGPDVEETRLDEAAPDEPSRLPEDERQRILDALQACAGNQTRAAELLGISRRTLVTRLGALKLPRPRKRP